MSGIIQQYTDLFTDVLRSVYEFARETLPNLLFHMITPLNELYPELGILPNVSMLTILFSSGVAIFLVRPIIHLVTDFIN